MTDPLDDLPEFEAAVRRRLEQGRSEYGDRSFSCDPAVLLAEVEEELLDVNGWSFVLWRRVRAMRAALASPPEPCDHVYLPGPGVAEVRCQGLRGHSGSHFGTLGAGAGVAW